MKLSRRKFLNLVASAGTVPTTPSSPQAVSEGRINVAIPAGVDLAAAIASAQSRPTTEDDGDERSHFEYCRASISMSAVSGASWWR